MVTPFAWIRPKLKYICVAFGIADMTLILVTSVCWYFIFDTVFNARQLENLYDRKGDELIRRMTSKTVFPHPDDDDEDLLRLRRILTSCDYAVRKKTQIVRIKEGVFDANVAPVAAPIAAAIGGFFVSGGTLVALWLVNQAAARKIQCIVILAAEALCSVSYILGIVLIVGNDWLCSIEYYYERFQYASFVLFASIAVFFTFKSYQVTVVILYLIDQAQQAKKHDAIVSERSKNAVLKLNKAMEAQQQNQPNEQMPGFVQSVITGEIAL